MSRKGNCLDNAMAENFFGIMKSELLYTENFESPEAFIKALDKYIEYYNNQSLSNFLGSLQSLFETASFFIHNPINNIPNFIRKEKKFHPIFVTNFI